MAEFSHNPVLLREVLQFLSLEETRGSNGGIVRLFDGTLGGAGHASEMMRQFAPNGILYGCDRDGEELERTRVRLETEFAGRCHLKHGNYSQVDELFPDVKFDVALMDLGCSSMQLDRTERGFSFQGDAPLDMRMDRSQGVRAEDVVNGYSAEELADLFYYFGGERESRRLARAIVEERMLRRFVSTRQLADFIEARMPRNGKRIHPATRVFQALRIEVNREFDHLQIALDKVLRALKVGGRMAIITFHSGEDKIVKDFGRKWARDYDFDGEVDVPELRHYRDPVFKILTRKPVEATAAEVEANPRARSARLRVFEKVSELL